MVVDCLLPAHRSRAAAERFFRSLRKRVESVLTRWLVINSAATLPPLCGAYPKAGSGADTGSKIELKIRTSWPRTRVMKAPDSITGASTARPFGSQGCLLSISTPPPSPQRLSRADDPSATLPSLEHSCAKLSARDRIKASLPERLLFAHSPARFTFGVNLSIPREGVRPTWIESRTEAVT